MIPAVIAVRLACAAALAAALLALPAHAEAAA